MTDTSSLFDAKYYQNALGLPYERNDYWLTFFSAIAESIIRSLRPQSVLDAGCGMGFLVESLWDRGVEARGMDISEFAISEVRRDIRPYCWRASLTDPIVGHYDLVTCIEVLEHLLPEQTETAIANLASVTETILFSSTPNELAEPTHFNIKPTIAWLKLFKEVGFWPDYGFDATFLCPHAILLRKQQPRPEDSLFLMSDLIRWKVAFVATDRRAIGLTKQQQDSAALLQQREELHARIVANQQQDSAALLQQREELHARTVAKQQQQSAALLREVDDLRAKHVADEAQLRKVTVEADIYRRKLSTNRTALETASAEVSRLKASEESLKSSVKTTNLLLRPAFIEMARHEAASQGASLRGLAASFLREVRLAVTRRRSRVLKEHANLLRRLEEVASSPLFDPVWYLITYPDVAASRMNPLTHYLKHGGLEGRSPGPRFDGAWYLETYPDVASAAINPLVHYLEFGAAEGRECRTISGEQEAPEVQDAESDLLQAALLRQRELLAASSLFDTAWYLEEYPDVALEGLDPLVHYIRHGVSDARNPGPEFDGEWYLRNYPDVAEAGVNPLIHYLQSGQIEARPIRALATRRPVDVLLRGHFADSMPIACFSVPEQKLRITVVTDSLEMKQPSDGVSVALVLAGLLARKAHASLRVITRRQPASASSFADILAANGITWQDDTEFLYAPVSGSRAIGVSDNEVFLTTSWQNTSAVRTLVDPARIFALLQEDERILCTPGDARLRCEETLQDADINYLVNSQALFENLTSGPEPLDSVRKKGIWFDPAFPRTTYNPPEATDPQAKKKLLFYASRYNPTNLYWRALEALAAAIESGVLPAADWEFHFVGSGIEPVNLPSGAIVRTHESQGWKEYLSLIQNMDLAVWLTGAGFSSHPQIELAAAGAVVVTNFRGHALSRYSENIISTNPGMEAMGSALAAAAKIAGDPATRLANYARSPLLRDWNAALEMVLQQIADRIGSQG
jgi:SAM-dependent methyltransferase